MKKLILSAIIAFSIVSCSTDENETFPTDTTSQLANVSAAFSTPSKLTGKTIDRGSIPVPVKDITVKTVNATAGLTTADVFFDIVATGGTNDYTIPGVFGGVNTFTATTTSVSAEASYAVPLTGTDATDLQNKTTAKVAELKGLTPYAVYASKETASNTNVNVTIGQAQQIPFIMETKQGRLITLFETKADLSATGYFVEVTGKAYATGDTSTQLGSTQTFDISGFKSQMYYWSNTNTKDGAHIDYSISIYTDSGKGTLVKSFNSSATVNSNIGKTVTFNVGLSDVTESINTAGFTWTAWSEQ
jgi:hypothetical protein